MEKLPVHGFYVAAQPFIDQTHALLDQLKTFYQELETAHPGLLYWPVLLTTDSVADDADLGQLFSFSFHFASLNVARIVTIYWTITAMLLSQLSRIYKRLQYILEIGAFQGDEYRDDLVRRSGQLHLAQNDKVMIDRSQVWHVDQEADILIAVRHICQSIDYFMQDDMVAMGPALALFPLGCVIELLQGQPRATRELKWVERALCRIHDRGVRVLTEFIPLLRGSLE